MIPKASLAHKIPNRVRLYVVSKKGADDYFRGVRETLEQDESVVEVKADARTGSILVFHEDEIESVLERAVRKGLFELTTEAEKEPRGSLPDAALKGLSRIDKVLRDATDGALDITGATALVLLGLGGLQAKRRQVLPPAATLVGEALKLVFVGESQKQRLARAAYQKKAKRKTHRLRPMPGPPHPGPTHQAGPQPKP